MVSTTAVIDAAQTTREDRRSIANRSTFAPFGMRPWARRLSKASAPLLWQHQLDPKGVVHVDGPTVHRVRLVSPALQGIDHRAIHEGQTLQHAAGVHRALSSNDALDHHRALHFFFKCFLGVLRGRAGDLRQLDVGLVDLDSFLLPSDSAPERPSQGSTDDSTLDSALHAFVWFLLFRLGLRWLLLRDLLGLNDRVRLANRLSLDDFNFPLGRRRRRRRRRRRGQHELHRHVPVVTLRRRPHGNPERKRDQCGMQDDRERRPGSNSALRYVASIENGIKHECTKDKATGAPAQVKGRLLYRIACPRQSALGPSRLLSEHLVQLKGFSGSTASVASESWRPWDESQGCPLRIRNWTVDRRRTP